MWGSQLVKNEICEDIMAHRGDIAKRLHNLVVHLFPIACCLWDTDNLGLAPISDTNIPCMELAL